ncbi:COX15/CtaA family protein [Chitinilyticum litopenaei]|uniref:COX15/CtaA family protein n=1 Tax=Chitinilyticum litopenaei TaxID=1121276 RepID=UPI00041AAE8B|nr:COX15/CtaA family protein [Chitinilyticum litopenaei]
MMLRKLLLGLILLCGLLIMVGAWVRLSDAGLGCPDWPGCYGHLTFPRAEHEISRAEAHFGQPVDPERAFKEMLHRYIAGVLGLGILALTLLGWRQWPDQRAALCAPLVLVIVQALFGMWTVTEKLMPAVVTLHLLGGMGLLALLVWLALRLAALPPSPRPAMLRGGRLLLVALVLQIALGGWVSSNYAGPACTDFPLCAGQLLPPDGLAAALRPDRPLGLNADGSPISLAQLMGIQILHRAGALLVLLLSFWQCRQWWAGGQRRHALLLAGLLLAQLALGVANAVLGLPLTLAVLHNGMAALLLAYVTWLVLAAAPLPQATRHRRLPARHDSGKPLTEQA